MVKYEYQTILITDDGSPTTAILNREGNKGWAVVSCSDYDEYAHGVLFLLERKFETEWECPHEDSSLIGPRSSEGYYKCHDCGNELSYLTGDDDE